MIGFWTGGNDFGIEGVWRWEETNEQISGFTNWAPGSPDGKSAENCMTVGFVPNSTDTFWKDAPCTGHHNYICQFRYMYGAILQEKIRVDLLKGVEMEVRSSPIEKMKVIKYS